MNTSDSAWLLRDKYNGIESPAYKRDLQALKKGEHVSYLIGWVPFLGCRINLDSKPLIPRPETEWWTEQVIRHLQTRNSTSISCLDLFSGSGCIGIAIATHEPRATVDFGEIEKKHLVTINKNITENHIDSARVRVLETDVFSSISRAFDIITANPPYIDIIKRPLLEKDLGVEPATALYADEDGLFFLRTLLQDLKKYLNPGGKAFIEFDSGQEDRIALIAKEAGVTVMYFNDQYGVPRFLMAE